MPPGWTPPISSTRLVGLLLRYEVRGDFLYEPFASRVFGIPAGLLSSALKSWQEQRFLSLGPFGTEAAGSGAGGGGGREDLEGILWS